MTDFLLVAGAGMGAWAWGPTWGHMKAPPEHPPRLYNKSAIGNVVSTNLSGFSNNTVVPRITPEDASVAIEALVGYHRLNSPVLVAHDVAAPLVLKAAAALDPPPRRIIMLGGWIPAGRRPPLSLLPLPLRMAFTLMTALDGIKGKGFKIQKHLVMNYLCSSMPEEEVNKSVGFFQPVPPRLLKRGISLRDLEPRCPITYVVLKEDKLTPPEAQVRMAQRLGPLELIEMDACHAAMLHQPKELARILESYA